MIANVNLALFPSNELLTFAKGTISLATAKRAQLPVIVPFLDNVTQKCDNFRSALERESKNPLIKLQSEKNDDLSDSFIAFRKQCESASTRRREGWSPAAKALLAVIRKHGWSAHNMGYKAKIAAITKITSEIRAKYPAELAMIMGLEWLEELEMAETALKALFQTVSLQQISAPSAELDIFTTQLNEFISTSLATVKASDTRAENKKNAEQTKDAAVVNN